MTLVLTEYRSERVELTSEDHAFVLRLTRGEAGDRTVFEAVTPTSDAHVYRLRPSGVVGQLALPSGLVLELRSRFELPWLVELLRFAGRLPDLRGGRTQMGSAPFLVDVLASALAREVEDLVAQGLAKGYVRRRYERPPYPGTPDIAVHLRRYGGRPDRLVTRARRLTAEIPHNQALASALRVLGRTSMSAEVALKVRRSSVALGRVSAARPHPADVRTLPLDRSTARYSNALQLAALVLEGAALIPRAGPQAGTSVLFNMATVWEDCVLRWVTAARTGQDIEVVGQLAFAIGRGGTLPAKADAVVRREGRVVELFDAKYKPGKGWPKRADVYQMVAYAQALGVRSATLVHPRLGSGRDAVTVGDITVRGVGIFDGWGRGAGPLDVREAGPAALGAGSSVPNPEVPVDV